MIGTCAIGLKRLRFKMLIIDFEGFTARLLYGDGDDGRWVVDVTADKVIYEFYKKGHCEGAKEVPYNQADTSLQGQFPPVVFWAIRGLHGLPLEFRGRKGE